MNLTVEIFFVFFIVISLRLLMVLIKKLFEKYRSKRLNFSKNAN